MKRMVMIAMGLILIAGSAFAQPFPGLPDTAYVGLFADLAHSNSRVNYGGAPAMFQWYIYWLPSNKGLQVADFAISIPSNVIGANVLEVDPAISIQLGQLTTGMTIAFYSDSCQTDWVFSHRLSSFLTSAAQSQIMVVEHPTVNPPAYQVGSCELGYPIYPVKRFTHLSLNYDGGTAVESKSWSAIKDLFR